MLISQAVIRLGKGPCPIDEAANACLLAQIILAEVIKRSCHPTLGSHWDIKGSWVQTPLAFFFFFLFNPSNSNASFERFLNEVLHDKFSLQKCMLS